VPNPWRWPGSEGHEAQGQVKSG